MASISSEVRERATWITADTGARPGLIALASLPPVLLALSGIGMLMISPGAAITPLILVLPTAIYTVLVIALSRGQLGLDVPGHRIVVKHPRPDPLPFAAITRITLFRSRRNVELGLWSGQAKPFAHVFVTRSGRQSLTADQWDAIRAVLADAEHATVQVYRTARVDEHRTAPVRALSHSDAVALVEAQRQWRVTKQAGTSPIEELVHRTVG